MADSIRAALSEAFAAAPAEDQIQDSTAASDTGPVTPPAAESTPESSGEIESTTQAGDKPVSAVASDQKPGQVAPTQSTPGTPAVGADPAPASWKAEEKAAWAALPEAAKAAVKRRETETLRVLSHSADARKHVEGFNRVLEPFAGILKHHGITDAMQDIVAPMLQTRAVLEGGNAKQKATVIANLVQAFGVDIGQLDDVLSTPQAQRAPVPQQAPRFDPKAVPELAPLFAIAERFQQQEQAQAAEQIALIEAEPHYEELREDIATIMVNAAERGVTMTTKQAYDRAVSYRPDLAPARTAPATTVAEAAAILARSRNAASTIAGAPRTGGESKPNGLRETIAAAMKG